MSNFLPRPFTGGGYQVMVNADRSILVKQGDSLSKYSMAIYGNFKRIDKFWRKRNGSLKRVMDENKDLILTGESLYHPDPLPKEPPGEGDPGSQPPLQVEYVAEFFRWLQREFAPTDWEVDWTRDGTKSRAGLNFTKSLLSSGYGIIGMKDLAPTLPSTAPLPIRSYHATKGDLFCGWPPEVCLPEKSHSNIWFPGAGCILKSSWWRSAKLTFDDFRGGFVFIEAGPNIVRFREGPTDMAAMIFGIKLPSSRVMAALDHFFRYGELGYVANVLVTAPGVALVASPGDCPFDCIKATVGYMTTSAIQ